MNEQQIKEFREAALPLMKWMSENLHPHTKAIVDSEVAELMEGLTTGRREPFTDERPT